MHCVREKTPVEVMEERMKSLIDILLEGKPAPEYVYKEFHDAVNQCKEVEHRDKEKAYEHFRNECEFLQKENGLLKTQLRVMTEYIQFNYGGK